VIQSGSEECRQKLVAAVDRLLDPRRHHPVAEDSLDGSLVVGVTAGAKDRPLAAEVERSIAGMA
jgi:hypothetical protein